MVDVFDGLFVFDVDVLYVIVNCVMFGFIWIEIDEVQYNLYVMLCFDLECDLIVGCLDMNDLVEVWNVCFFKDFDVVVDCLVNGVLQDVYWVVGFFGYFLIYVLGNVYVGCLNVVMCDVVLDFDCFFVVGDVGFVVEWLCENMQCYGGLYLLCELIECVIGVEISELLLLDYLE